MLTVAVRDDVTAGATNGPTPISRDSFLRPGNVQFIALIHATEVPAPNPPDSNGDLGAASVDTYFLAVSHGAGCTPGCDITLLVRCFGR